jgi:hypothetical protein
VDTVVSRIDLQTYTLKTPGGMPAFSHSSAMIMVAPGSRSDGLTMRVFPDVSLDQLSTHQ